MCGAGSGGEEVDDSTVVFLGCLLGPLFPRKRGIPGSRNLYPSQLLVGSAQVQPLTGRAHLLMTVFFLSKQTFTAL